MTCETITTHSLHYECINISNGKRFKRDTFDRLCTKGELQPLIQLYCLFAKNLGHFEWLYWNTNSRQKIRQRLTPIFRLSSRWQAYSQEIILFNHNSDKGPILLCISKLPSESVPLTQMASTQKTPKHILFSKSPNMLYFKAKCLYIHTYITIDDIMYFH